MMVMLIMCTSIVIASNANAVSPKHHHTAMRDDTPYLLKVMYTFLFFFFNVSGA